MLLLGKERITLEILGREGLARTGRFHTPHGVVMTPNIMPVINPNIRTLSMDRMKKAGTTCLITNSYIIRRNADLREKALKDGLHSLIGFDGPIMTDSGTFQSYVYGDVEFQNRDTVEFQLSVGSDISTILDIFSTPDDSRDKAADAVRVTAERFHEVEDLAETNDLSGPIQGSIYPELREKSARIMSSSGASYLPIGGVVPLLEQYRYAELVDIIMSAKLNSNFSKPIHLFGGGHPMFMGMAVLLGVDMFDSASYVKYAKDGRMLYPEGTRDLKDIMELPYWSPLRDRYTAEELRREGEEKRKSLLAEHNLYAIFMEISEIRERIHEQTLWQYVESRARSHPSLFNAFKRILEYSGKMQDYLELYRKPPFMGFDNLSMKSPYAERLKSLEIRPDSVDASYYYSQGTGMSKKFLDEYYENSDNNYHFTWGELEIPVEMEESYPVQQAIMDGFPSIRVQRPTLINSGHARNFNLEKIRFLADFQFGKNSGKALFPDDSQITVSRSTGRIRTVSLEGKILATMRVHDGYLALTMEGGERIRKSSPEMKNRVMVTKESAEFNSQGKSVFFNFIKECDPGIIPYNDVLVVDPDDVLVAVGRPLVSGKEMMQYRKGVAVSINHHLKP